MATAVPVALRGPDYVLDDWYLLANARFDGWWNALGGELVRARPGSGVVYAATHGLVGRHPLVALVVQVVLASAVAVVLWDLVRRFLSPVESLAVAALWVLLPNHGSLLYWTTGAAITVALLLLLLGCRALLADRPALAALLFAASVLTYEATAPAAVAAAVGVPWLLGRPWRRSAVVGAAMLLPAGLWVAVNRPSVKRGLGQTADLGQLLPAHVGWGVLPDRVAVLGGTAACVVVTLLAVEVVRGRRVTREAAMVAGGVALIGLGTIPFVRYFYAPLGAGDRVNVVAGVGTALVWAAVLLWTARRAPAIVRPVVVLPLLGFAVATWQATEGWAAAADDSVAVLASLGDVGPGDRVVVTRSEMHRNVAAFLDQSNISSAVQLEAGTRDVEVRLVRPDR